MDDVYVSTTGSDTTGDGTPGNPYQTITKGITEVNPDGVVHIAAGTYNEAITIAKNLDLLGENKDTTIIDATGLGSRVITINLYTVNIKNLTIQNGLVTDTTVSGGGIYNYQGLLTVTDCIIQNNNATATGTSAIAFGGGIYNDQGLLNIINSTIQNNNATANETYGIAEAHGGGIYNDGTLTITNSTIQNNTATATGNNTNARGGGIYNYGPLTITN
ncbi:MAG: hypothetical protein ACP5C3_00745, partial [Methanomicrobiales archaeon]